MHKYKIAPSPSGLHKGTFKQSHIYQPNKRGEIIRFIVVKLKFQRA
jgi:hypothetical protein